LPSEALTPPDDNPISPLRESVQRLNFKLRHYPGPSGAVLWRAARHWGHGGALARLAQVQEPWGACGETWGGGSHPASRNIKRPLKKILLYRRCKQLTD